MVFILLALLPSMVALFACALAAIVASRGDVTALDATESFGSMLGMMAEIDAVAYGRERLRSARAELRMREASELFDAEMSVDREWSELHEATMALDAVMALPRRAPRVGMLRGMRCGAPSERRRAVGVRCWVMRASARCETVTLGSKRPPLDDDGCVRTYGAGDVYTSVMHM